MIEYRGRAFCFGDDVNTDYIISSRRKKDTIDPAELVAYLMEDIRPGFAQELSGVSILVAGENFGCGSAMEVAAQVVREAGIPVVLAKSFARSYFRNAVNNGILPLQTDTRHFKEGDMIAVSMGDLSIRVQNETTGYETSCPAFSPQLQEILSAGGLIPYMKRNKKSRRA